MSNEKSSHGVSPPVRWQQEKSAESFALSADLYIFGEMYKIEVSGYGLVILNDFLDALATTQLFAFAPTLGDEFAD